ncbi:phosphate carrier protein, mitochondrial [Cephus cinctus]|uniref:Phosphate carrier protein, mitochondrial n=1 Tax=Cephus cinctus TaxID=211228 RepID=A0AAJ7CCE3_CEPCN|nr:phosphate carrier protein, mitochondrial [Cephus cinctus]
MFVRCVIKIMWSIKDFIKEKLIVRADSAAGAPAGQYCCEFGSRKYFLLCGVGGIVSCGITHTLITPLDLIKCRLQVDSAKYKNLAHGFKITVAEEGILGLTKGWLPTLYGYSIQGFLKFGLYEWFKVYYAKLVGEEIAYDYRTWIFLMSSASAEFFADIGLAPFEACKVRIQTSTGFTSSLTTAMKIMMQEGGPGVFYKGLVPLWLRQIPYTMMKFTCFERTLELLYKLVVPKPRADCTKAEQLVVTFAAGYIAGVFCAVVSHPADSVVSKLNQEKGSTAIQIAKKIGWAGMWMGLGPRIVMIGTLTGLQWFLYDAFKVFTRMPRPPPLERSKTKISDKK